MGRGGVGVRIDRNGRDPHPLRGADDAARDLAAIGNEQGSKQGPDPGWRPIIT
jgi:hypothetical protein